MIVKEDQRFPFSQFDLCYTVKATNPNFKEKQTCNNFSLIFRTVFHWYSFTQPSNLFFGNKSNSDYKWSTKYLPGLVGKQINKQYQHNSDGSENCKAWKYLQYQSNFFHNYKRIIAGMQNCCLCRQKLDSLLRNTSTKNLSYWWLQSQWSRETTSLKYQKMKNK